MVRWALISLAFLLGAANLYFGVTYLQQGDPYAWIPLPISLSCFAITGLVWWITRGHRL